EVNPQRMRCCLLQQSLVAAGQGRTRRAFTPSIRRVIHADELQGCLTPRRGAQLHNAISVGVADGPILPSRSLLNSAAYPHPDPARLRRNRQITEAESLLGPG